MTLLATEGIAGTEEPFPSEQSPATAPPREGIETVDDALGSEDTPEFEPAGGGTEGSTSNSSMQTLLEVEPDRGQTLVLEEIAMAVESNGAVQVGVNGTVYGEFTGSTDISLPFNGAVVPYGGLVRVQHRSTDSNTTTTKALVTAKEV